MGGFSIFSSKEITVDLFVVIEVKDMCVNSYMGARFQEIGHIVIFQSNEKMDQCFR